jgi:hypothetical protein
MQYILALLDHTPDIQLSDVAKHLKNDRNVDVDISTVWRGLVKKAGWTLKCVSLVHKTHGSMLIISR